MKQATATVNQMPPMELPTLLHDTSHSAIQWLIDHQQEEGFWVGLLESNACMEAEWLLAKHFLGIENDPKEAGIVRGIFERQREDGSWQVYYGAKGGDINTTVECYAALRSTGVPASDPRMVRARDWILDRGGLAEARNFTKYWLALIGEWPWSATPMLPPEIIYLPSWAPFNIYQFASWGRGTILPLAILASRRPSRPLPEGRRLDELFPEGREKQKYQLQRRHAWWSWEGPFYVMDRLLRYYNLLPAKPGREASIRLCLEWILKHQDADGAWSGIQPPWIYSLMALHVEGYPLDHPALRSGWEAFDAHWSYESGKATYLQASESPVWDTALAMLGMIECGYTTRNCPALQPALEWLLEKQADSLGDWHVTTPGIPSGGWAFQRANRHYPDVDDTAIVLMVLHHLRQDSTERDRIEAAIDQGVGWLLGMQSSNGGWGAFDRDNDHPWLTRIPFCDFGELLDPPSVDVTAHVVEALCLLGWKRDDPPVARALNFIRQEQEEDGSWFGRWGVNHIYGTAAVLPALQVAGFDMREPWIRQAADWLANHQNRDGGWGESCASYMDDSLRGIGPSTASQTAWALMALVSVDQEAYAGPIADGVRFLADHQKEGTWDEPEYTGTGFPGYGVGHRIDLDHEGKHLGQSTDLERAFMINYNLYRHYFPLIALGRCERGMTGKINGNASFVPSKVVPMDRS